MQSTGNGLAVDAAGIERRINPARVAQQLQHADVATIAEVFAEARALGSRAWMATSVCAGIAQARAARGDRVLDELARVFCLHRSRIARLGRIYRELLLPRIELAGEAATFVLAEQAWYEIAVEAAEALARPPLELLAEAEDAKLEDPRFSTRRWKTQLGLTASGDDADKLRAVLVRLSGVEDDVLGAFKESSGNRDLLERAAAVLARAGIEASAPSERPLGYIAIDAFGVVVGAAESIAGRFGATAAQMVGRSVFDWASCPEDARGAFDRLRAGVPAYRITGDFRAVSAATGEPFTIRDLEVTLNYSPGGLFKGVSLHEPLAWRGVRTTEQPGCGWAVVLDAAGVLSYVEPAFAHALGYEPGELADRPIGDLLVHIEAISCDGVVSDASADFRCRDGRLLRVTTRCFSVEGDSGSIGVVARILTAAPVVS